MPHSYAETLTLTCAACGRDFDAEFWLIVDTAERPDLLERIRAGNLHDLACPHCGDAGHMDAPLLLFRPDDEPVLLFSPAEETTADEDQELAGQLLELLQDALSDQWQDDWLAEGLRSVPRALLPTVLSDDTESAMAEMAERAAAELARLQEEDPARFAELQAAMDSMFKETAPLVPLIEQFIRAETWDASQRIVQQHPELLGDEAGRLLDTLIASARMQGDDRAVQMFEEHRALLRRCREAGVARAFAEKMLPIEALAQAEAAGLTPEQVIEMQQAAAQMPPDLMELFAELAASGVELRSPADLEAALASRPDLAARLEAAAQVMGMSGGMNVPPQFQTDLQQAQEAEQRYQRTSDRNALNAAAAAWQRILDHPTFPTSDDWFQLAVLNNAGDVFLRRYWAQGQLADLHEALQLCQTAVQRTPPDSPDLPSRLNNLGNSLKARYTRTGRLEDLEAAIDAAQRVVQLTPVESPHLPGRLSNLSNGLRDRYARTGRPEDLEAAIDAAQRAVQRTPADSAVLPGRLNILGTGLRDRYTRTGRLEDLEAAIDAAQRAVQRTLVDSPDLPMFLNNLGAGLYDRYARTGRLEDLAAAIDIWHEAVHRTPVDSPDLPMFRTNLGNGLRDRYARTGRMEDLEEAIDDAQRAVQQTPVDSPDLPGRLNNLGIGQRDRYARTGQMKDLEAAIDAWQRAAEKRRSENSPDLPMFLNNLGSGLRDRYARTGQREDLEAAIDAWQRALHLTPLDSPPPSPILTNLGTGLRDRYALTGSLEDLEAAIDATQRAVDRTPADSPNVPGKLSNLANSLRDRHTRTGQMKDLEAAQDAYARACARGVEVSLQETLRGARNWSNWGLERRAWEEVVDAYVYGRQAIDLLFATQLSRAAKESWLKEAQGLPANAAYALARLDRPEDAVEAIEAGRARLLAEALEQNRRDLERLPELGRGDLLARYRAASGRVVALQQQAGQPVASSGDGPSGQRDYARWRQQLEEALNEQKAAIDAIRALMVDGQQPYADFLLAPSFGKIQQAATPGAPLVYLAATPVGSVALVVRADVQKPGFSEKPGFLGSSPVSVVWLDGFNEAGLDALLVQRQDGEVTGGYLPGQLGDHEALTASLQDALPTLGEHLLGPLAAHLRGQDTAAVALIPAGRLSLLPLHAAPYTVGGEARCLLDEFAVRYAPSAASLAAAHGEAQRRAAPLYLAGVGNPLPDFAAGAWASERAQAILARLPAAPAGERLAAARAILQALAAAPPHAAIRAGVELIMAARDLALGGAAPDLVLRALEIAQRIPPSLDYAEAELRSVLDLLPADGGAWTAYGEQATAATLWQALPAATTLHLACHGQFNPQEPLDSALLLGAGSRITLRELLERDNSAALAGLRLAFLSACQTAISDFRTVPDEAIGLPAAFLQAGIPAVVGTLWPVNDASTALLATRFYELHLHGDPAENLPPQPPAAALRLAQRWLRDVSNAKLAVYLEGHRRLKEASEQEQQRMSWALIKETRREVRRAVAAGQGDARPYAAAYHWAPFVFYGAG